MLDLNNNIPLMFSPLEWQGNRQGRHFPTAALCDTSTVYNVELQYFVSDYKFTSTLGEKPVRKEVLEESRQKKGQTKCKTEQAVFFLCLFFSLPFVFCVESRINYAVFIVMLLS